MEERWLSDDVFTVPQFLTPEQCRQHIEFGEDVGFEEALVTGPDGPQRYDQVRNNDRVMFKDFDIANKLWQRASDFVPSEWAGRQPIGANELIRLYR